MMKRIHSLKNLAFLGLAVLCLCAGPIACGRSVQAPEADEKSLSDARKMDKIEEYIRDGRYEEAGLALENALNSGLRHPRAFYLRGRLSFVKDSPEELETAITWFNKSIEISPRWYEPRFYRAEAYMRLNREFAARTDYNALDAMLPNHPVGPYGKAVFATRQENYEDANVLINEALERNPYYSPALQLAVRVAIAQGETDLARQYLRRLVDHHSQEVSIYRELARLALSAGELQEARRWYEQAWQVTEDPQIAEEMAEVLTTLGRPNEAAEWRAKIPQKSTDQTKAIK